LADYYWGLSNPICLAYEPLPDDTSPRRTEIRPYGKKIQAGAMAPGLKRMLLLKIPAKQGIIAESEANEESVSRATEECWKLLAVNCNSV
jgi:hypothetical protein